MSNGYNLSENEESWFVEYCEGLFERVGQIHSDNIVDEMFIKYEN